MTDAEKVKILTPALESAMQYVGAAIAEGYLKENVIPGQMMLQRLQQILRDVATTNEIPPPCEHSSLQNPYRCGKCEAVLAERERCAKIAEAYDPCGIGTCDHRDTAGDIAGMIREQR